MAIPCPIAVPQSGLVNAMEHKRILVLANSYKHKARCIAGREPSGGRWIRPISQHGEGELLGHETRLADGSQARVLQYISVPLERCANDPLQPENWLIHGVGNWVDASADYPPVTLCRLIEWPRDLWQEPGGFSECATHRWLQSVPPRQSLYLIRTKNFRVRVELRDGKEKWRAVFQYRGNSYNFPITDPVFLRKYSKWPCGKTLPIESPLRCGDHCVLCVSLGGNFQGKHYKIAATIFENVP